MEDVLSFVNEIRPYLEVLYFVAGVVVACAAVFALKQISILKRTLHVQSKRDALKITSEQCENYFSNIIDLKNQFFKKVKEHNIEYFNGWEVTVTNNVISVKHKSTPSIKGLDKLAEEFRVLNSIESFSSFFVSNLADEQVAYDTVGMTFLRFNRELMPWILSCNEKGHYNNLTTLFVKWETRRMNDELQRQKLYLDEKIKQASFKSDVPLGAENR
ncbi:hypothetical protein J8M20_07155 [Pseudoalteromonas luteoviolacea]|uniref:hypothetical protein n=1 Tax=Pseudoalteromonas luteoviolacea TaxID=43657 RepID=UPI001B3975EB|nr:hypothetical protein [Pseudoalteromonas luteoviolacea]MBQ4811108.1 hypothetical protein [Pseudoalteromonas luteoviolacea]